MGGTHSTSNTASTEKKVISPINKRRKKLLLHLVFAAIDDDNSGSIDRAECMRWIQREPYLQLPQLQQEATQMLDRLDHDEDSLISEKEFRLVFDHFTAVGVARLIVNLIRPIPVTNVSLQKRHAQRIEHDDIGNRSHGLTSEAEPLIDEGQTEADGVELANAIPELVANAPNKPTNATTPNTGQASSLSSSSSSSSSSSLSSSSSSSSSTSSSSSSKPSDLSANIDYDADQKAFLIDILFHAIDSDLNDTIDSSELVAFVHADTFFDHDELLNNAIINLTRILQSTQRSFRRRASESAIKELIKPDNTKVISEKDFKEEFNNLSLNSLQSLFIHLLSRAAIGRRSAGRRIDHRAFLEKAEATVPEHEQPNMKLVSGRGRSTSIFTSTTPITSILHPVPALPRTQTHPIHKPSPPPSSTLSPPSGTSTLAPPPTDDATSDILPPTATGLRIALMGQSMIQHDLRKTSNGLNTLHHLSTFLSTCDLIFTELETAIVGDKGGAPQRKTVFFHAAGPFVIDCLQEIGVNLLACSNNHAGDLGEPGVLSLMEEITLRGVVFAGVGRNLAEASAPAYVDIVPAYKRNWRGSGVVQKRSSMSAPSTPLSSPMLSPSITPAWLEDQTAQLAHDDKHQSNTPPSQLSPWMSPPQTPPQATQQRSLLPPLTPMQLPGPSPHPYSTRISLVAVASKVPPGTEATPTHAGVNHLSMIDQSTGQLNETEVERILSSISSARQHSSIVVLYHHNHYWSNSAVNEEATMGAWKRQWAHACIDSGATIYVAHGDPRLQGIEIYKGCPIFFCLGNLFFQTKTEIGFYGPEVWESCIVTLEYHPDEHGAVDGAETMSSTPNGTPRSSKRHRPMAANTAPAPSPAYSIRLQPIIINEVGEKDNHLATRGLPRLAPPAEARAILARIQKMSAEFGTHIHVDDTAGDFIIGWVLPGKPDLEAGRKNSFNVRFPHVADDDTIQVKRPSPAPPNVDAEAEKPDPPSSASHSPTSANVVEITVDGPQSNKQSRL